MAQAIPIISLFSTAFGMYQTYRSKQEMKKATARNAQMEEEMAKEEARRTEIEQAKTESLARARLAASGTTGGGTMADWLAQMREEHKSDIDWIIKSGKTRAEAIRLQGKSQQAEMSARLFQQGASLAGSYYTYGSQGALPNWMYSK